MPAHFNYPHKRSAESLFAQGFTIQEVAMLAGFADEKGCYDNPYDLDNPAIYNEAENKLRYQRYLYEKGWYRDDS